MTQKGLWNVAREKMLRDRGALPNEEGDLLRECKALHEENFLSSWLREDVASAEKKKDVDKVAREEENRSGKGEVMRRCVNPFSRGNFVFFFCPWRCWETLVFLVVALLWHWWFVGVWVCGIACACFSVDGGRSGC